VYTVCPEYQNETHILPQIFSCENLVINPTLVALDREEVLVLYRQILIDKQRMSSVTGFSGAQIESVIWDRFANQEVLSSVIWSLQVHLSRSGPTTSDGREVSRVGSSQKLELLPCTCYGVLLWVLGVVKSSIFGGLDTEYPSNITNLVNPILCRLGQISRKTGCYLPIWGYL
jgi:hypothetical protein